MSDVVTRLIERFALTTLPGEGTLFRSTWRSSDDLNDGGPQGTAMIGLYCNDPVSHSLFHRLPVDEVWPRVEKFAAKHLQKTEPAKAGSTTLLSA
jgi:predicted cupin superfamily sugar epimerase